jgi:hypothetical protein
MRVGGRWGLRSSWAMGVGVRYVNRRVERWVVRGRREEVFDTVIPVEEVLVRVKRRVVDFSFVTAVGGRVVR